MTRRACRRKPRTTRQEPVTNHRRRPAATHPPPSITQRKVLPQLEATDGGSAKPTYRAIAAEKSASSRRGSGWRRDSLPPSGRHGDAQILRTAAGKIESCSVGTNNQHAREVRTSHLSGLNPCSEQLHGSVDPRLASAPQEHVGRATPPRSRDITHRHVKPPATAATSAGGRHTRTHA